jgi:aminoglycoside 6'-N-acetyltransferase I
MSRDSSFPFRVRPARPADLSSWSELRSALWPDQPAEELIQEAEAFFRGENRLLELVLLAEEPGGGLLGFAELALRPYAEDCRTSPVAYLEGWFVIPEARRQGVGRALVAAAEDWGREQGCSEFASDTHYDNRLSVEAHHSLGFDDAGINHCFRKSL